MLLTDESMKKKVPLIGSMLLLSVKFLKKMKIISEKAWK